MPPLLPSLAAPLRTNKFAQEHRPQECRHAFAKGKFKPLEFNESHAAGNTFHGSYIEPGHLVVRAIEIEPKLDGLLHVRNLLRDTHTLHGGILEAFGYLSFVEGKPHIVTYHSDNARGAVLFVGDQLSPADGKPIKKATGQMIGMTKNHQHFSRAMLMLRLPNEMPESDILTETGIFPPDKLPTTFQGHFDELKRQLPKEAFPDPIRTLP